MRAKFNKSFLTVLNTAGKTVRLDKFKIYSLTDRTNLLDPSRQSFLKEGVLYSIWNQETKILDITVEFKLNNGEVLTETNTRPLIIYLFEDSKYSKNLDPAVVLYGDSFSKLNLTSRGMNHITLQLPNTTAANLLGQTKYESQAYIEKTSNSVGTNLFLNELGLCKDEELITKNSFKKFVRNKLIKLQNSPIYLNKDGEKVVLHRDYKRYKKVEIFCSNLGGYKEKDGTWNYYLPDDSGDIKLTGKCTFDLYRAKDNIFELVEKDLQEDISNVVIKGEGYNSNSFRIGPNKTIYYDNVEGSSINTFYGELYFIDEMEEGLSLPLKSNEVKFYQYSAWDKPVTTTNFFEDDSYVFLFNPYGEPIGENLSSKSHQILIRSKKKYRIEDLVVVHDPILSEYFKIETGEGVLSEDSKYEYSITITTKKMNIGNNWFPLVGEKSKLISCTASLGPNNKMTFYCIQGAFVPLSIKNQNGEILSQGSGINGYISYLEGSLGKKEANYFISGPKLEDDYNNWSCIEKFNEPSLNFLSKTSGKIDNAFNSKSGITLSSYCSPDPKKELEIGSLKFTRCSKSGIIDSSNWRDVLYSKLSNCDLTVKINKDISKYIESSTNILKGSEKKRVYLFDHNKKIYSQQESTIHWFEYYLTEELDQSKIQLSMENDLDKFFNIVVRDPIPTEGNWFKYRVEITAKNINNSDKWFPTNSGGNSELKKATLKLVSNNGTLTEDFYVVQGFNIPPINTYLENDKPVWINLTDPTLLSPTDTGAEFEFSNTASFNDYTGNDNNILKHKVGDIIAQYKILGGLKTYESFRMLVSTYKKIDGQLDFSFVGETKILAFSSPVNKFRSIRNITKDKNLVILEDESSFSLNNELTDIGNGLFIYSKTDKNKPRADHRVFLRNLKSPGSSDYVFNTIQFDRISNTSTKTEDLYQDWEFCLYRGNKNSCSSIINSKLIRKGENDSRIEVRVDDNKAWKNINLLPLNYLGIYRIYVSSAEDFIVSLSSLGDNFYFFDESYNKASKTALSIKHSKTVPGQYVPIYFAFEGSEGELFKSPFIDLNTTIKISWEKNNSISKTINLRRYFINNLPSEDGSDLGSSTSTGNYLPSNIKRVGGSGLGEILSKTGHNDIFTIDTEQGTSWELQYESNVEANIISEIVGKVESSITSDIREFRSNTYTSGSSYIGEGKGYLYTKSNVTYPHMALTEPRYPMKVLDNISLEHPRNYDKQRKDFVVYKKLDRPDVTIADFRHPDRVGNKIYLRVGSLGNVIGGRTQKLYIKVAVPGQSLKVSNYNNGKLLSGDKTYINHYSTEEIAIGFKIKNTNASTSKEIYLGSIEVRSYVDKNNFLLDNSGNVRLDKNTYDQNTVDILTGATTSVFHIYLPILKPDIELPKPTFTISSPIVPAAGGLISVELNPLLKNKLLNQSPDPRPYNNSNLSSEIIKVDFGVKQSLLVEFADRRKRIGYDNGLSLLSANVGSPKNLANENILTEIGKYSANLIADNFSVSFKPEVSGESITYFDTSTMEPSIVQETYKYGIIVGYFVSRDDMLQKRNMVFKLFIGDTGNEILGLKRDYMDDSDPVYITSVKLPVNEGLTEFSTDTLTFNMDYDFQKAIIMGDDILNPSYFCNYTLYLGRSSNNIYYKKNFTVLDNRGTKVLIQFEQGEKS